MPEITLSLPVAIVALVVILVAGAAAVFFTLRGSGNVASDPTATATLAVTPTASLAPTEAPTSTPEPTFTPLPPLDYTVKENDTCISIANAFHITTNSLILLNDLPAACNTLTVGQPLKVPQPTPTASPQPTGTLSAAQATSNACQTLPYTVAANDTLSSISANYGLSMAVIKQYNGLTTDTVYEGQTLTIPLCERQTPGPTPTDTPPPPYAAANLLLPADGAAFTLANDTVTLQWASVGDLRSNEAYAVTVEDVTDGNGRKLVEYVTDTKFIVPTSFRPSDSLPHVMRWSVLPVRQTGTDASGKPTWAPAGAVSVQRDFTWSGVAGPTSAPVNTPVPTQAP